MQPPSVHLPQLGRVDRGFAHVEGVEHAAAVALEPARRRRSPAMPMSGAGRRFSQRIAPVARSMPTASPAVRGEDHEVAGDAAARRAHAGLSTPVVGLRPHERRRRARRGRASSSGRPSDDRAVVRAPTRSRRRGIPSSSTTIDASVSSPVQNRNVRVRLPTREQRRRCPSPGRARPSWRSRAVSPEIATEFSIDTSLPDVVRAARRPSRACGTPSSGATVTRPSAPVAAVELHDVDLAVLAALEEVVVQHERAAVPVVVPQRGRHVVRRELPQLGRLRTVDREHAEVVVARPDVDEREAVGVDRHRALDDVAGHERREDVARRSRRRRSAPRGRRRRTPPTCGRRARTPRAGRSSRCRTSSWSRPCPPTASTCACVGVLPRHVRARAAPGPAVVAAGRVAAEREQPGTVAPA